ncbi:M23 family metallopeptidase [Marinimicrobium sp. ABcell2]|uniref:M23 family metallopeptidase n=1 Tax=Marinimicrobium sp. ABcell2 TaxID=3069751 RepID=UPI0027B6553E|nr:M23 family metallopeptidase [Marinimicrobium sp. ABcell2]MDQ2077188.1 M23 family metallopeptidase [Marinimicrobium sp. ABcell2]
MTTRLIIAALCSLFSAGAAALEIQGEWKQGAVLLGRVEPGSQVEFLQRQVRVAEDGRFVVGLGRDAEPEAVLKVTPPNGETEKHRFDVVQREYHIQRVEGVPQQTVTPDPKQVERSRKEAALAWQARQRDSEYTFFSQSFEWPLTGRISGVYGSQRYFNGEPRAPHYGVDIAAPTGTPARAPADGVVTLVHDDMFFSGGTLIMDHGHGLSSTFIHLHKILVEEGDYVEQGQVVAQVGATGRATGPHLDWRMNWFDQRVDPTLLVGPMPE